MGIMGKVIGGTIGFAIGGPLGAIAGAAFGHAYDNINKADFKRVGSGGYEYIYENISSIEQTQGTFFIAAFSMLAKIAKADGQVSKEEIDSIKNFMLHDLNLNPQARAYAENIFRAAVNSNDTFGAFAEQFYFSFRNQPQMLELMIDILLRVAVSDGNLSSIEENLILEAVRIFNFSDSQYKKLKSKYVREPDKYYAVLGCDRSDSDEHIKTMYRKRVLEFHPDKIASKGLPEEFTKFSNDKFREIQEAYEIIKKERRI